jgi:hypothetical protein
MRKNFFLLIFVLVCVLSVNSFFLKTSQSNHSASSRDIINEITINMFGSLRAEEDYSLIIDGYGIPLEWVVYGCFPWTAVDLDNIKQNIEETHARGLKYVHHIPIERMYSDGEQQLGDRRPKLRKYCIIDIDGKKFINDFDGIPVYNMNLNEKGWESFIRSEIRSAIDAGADGILLDEIQAQTLYIGFESGGVFNKVDMTGFRKFLKKVYTNQELSSRFGINNIESFNYRNYLNNNGYNHTWRTAPWEAPLFNEFRVYEIQATLKVQKKMIAWAKRYAKSKYNRDIVFMGNTSDGMAYSLPFEVNLDAAWCEYPYLFYNYPPHNKIIPSAKLRVDDRWKKGLYLTQVPTNANLVDRGSIPNIIKVFWAEAYAANAECNVPYEVPASSTHTYSPDLLVLAPYFRFIDKYRQYYGGDWSWKPRVGFFYPLSSNLGIPDSYIGSTLALFEAGIQFDVIFSGDGRMIKNNCTLKKLQEYPVIIYPNAAGITKRQMNLILNYLKEGGTVIGWGNIGPTNEFGHFVKDLPDEWTLLWTKGVHYHGKGVFVNISQSEIGDAYFKDRKLEKRNKIVNGIKPYASPEVTSTAPEDVNFLVYVDSANKRLALHMINYRYNIKIDRIKAAKKFFVTISLPVDFSVTGKNATLYSPDLNNPKNVKIQKKSATTIKLKIPKLEYYNLLVIE